MLALGRADSVAANIGAAAVFLVLLAGALRSITTGLRATEEVDERFSDKQAKARSSIEANHVVPSMSTLLSHVVARLPRWSLTQMSLEEFESLMQDELQAADYVDDLRALGRLAMDHAELDAHYRQAEHWGMSRGFCGIVLLVALLPLGSWFVFSDWDPPVTVIWSAAAIAFAAVLALAVCWIVETVFRRKLVRLCRRYGA